MYVAAFLSESSPDVSIRKHSCRLLSASSDRACARQTRPRPHAHSRDPSARHAFLIDNSMLVCYTASQVMSWHDSKVHPPCLKPESRRGAANLFKIVANRYAWLRSAEDARIHPEMAQIGADIFTQEYKAVYESQVQKAKGRAGAVDDPAAAEGGFSTFYDRTLFLQRLCPGIFTPGSRDSLHR